MGGGGGGVRSLPLAAATAAASELTSGALRDGLGPEFEAAPRCALIRVLNRVPVDVGPGPWRTALSGAAPAHVHIFVLSALALRPESRAGAGLANLRVLLNAALAGPCAQHAAMWLLAMRVEAQAAPGEKKFAPDVRVRALRALSGTAAAEFNEG